MDTNNNSNQTTTTNGTQGVNSQVIYPSGELLLSVVQKEYDYESARKTALETRAGILITLAAVILTFTFSNVKIPKIKSPIEEFSTLIFYVSYFLIGIISIATIIVSLFYLLRVIFVSEYRRFETSTLNDENASYMPDIVATALTKQYHEIISINHKANTQKTELYIKGSNYLIIALFASVLLYGLALNL